MQLLPQRDPSSALLLTSASEGSHLVAAPTADPARRWWCHRSRELAVTPPLQPRATSYHPRSVAPAASPLCPQLATSVYYHVYHPFEGVPARLYIALGERATWKVLDEYY